MTITSPTLDRLVRNAHAHSRSPTMYAVAKTRGISWNLGDSGYTWGTVLSSGTV